MTMNITNDFPMLNRKIFDKDITYLDSAACSLKPYTVIETERLYGINLTSNVHRSHNALSEDLSYQYERVREKISEFIHSDPVSVIMTPNTSYALTMIANGLQLCSDDKVLCSMMNHNSNLLPWMNVAKVVYFQSENIEPLSLDSVITAIEYHQPKVLAISYISNVSGVMNPIAEICKLAHERGVITVIDAAQAAPHVPINVATLNCNFLAFSGHKILGPTGTGILYGKYELLENLKPLVLAGGTVDKVTNNGYILKDLPHRLEPGTPNISGVLGLGTAIDYIQNIGFEYIMGHENKLIKAMQDSLINLPGVELLIGKSECEHIAIASIVPVEANIHSDELCQILSDSFQIMTRSGFHCAHQFFNNYSYAKGAVRISAYLYNTEEDIYKVSDALKIMLSRVT